LERFLRSLLRCFGSGVTRTWLSVLLLLLLLPLGRRDGSNSGCSIRLSESGNFVFYIGDRLSMPPGCTYWNNGLCIIEVKVRYEQQMKRIGSTIASLILPVSD